ncbi:MAG TPA: hypothetical protein VL863_10795, partial [bacterium]|nr:hypothetical protein [bacterium]
MKSLLKRRALMMAPFLVVVASLLSCATGKSSAVASGLVSRPPTKAFLQMPARADGVFPHLLSQTGAFADTTNLVPAAALTPYDLIVPFWSDGAEKSRWISVPSGERIKFAVTGEWVFPKGTVFVKHFELATDATHPEQKRRLETRLLVCDADGGVYGATYKWRADSSDADLLETNLTEAITIRTATGMRKQEWYYPSRADCLTCHTANAGYVLGVKTRQLNRDFKYLSPGSAGVSPASLSTPGRQDASASGLAPVVTDNQLCAWNHLGLFDT